MAASPTETYAEFEDQFPQDVYIYKLGVQDLFVVNIEGFPTLYKRSGSTRNVLDLIEHDGYALWDGNFCTVEKDDGVVAAYHPYAGRLGTIATDELESDAILLAEVERLV